MSFRIVIEPIERWPLPDTRGRPYAPFRADYSDTEELLNRELRTLNARGVVVIQVVTRNGAGDVRRDGMLRAQAKTEHPGVRLSFESKHGPLTYATDAFAGSYNRPGWQQNLRAIALGLEALRKVDRYGISRSGEQYRGWQQLEAGPAQSPIDVLARWAGPQFGAQYRDDLPRLVRAARIGAHPDRHDGDHTGSDEVIAAIRALGLDER